MRFLYGPSKKTGGTAVFATDRHISTDKAGVFYPVQPTPAERKWEFVHQARLLREDILTGLPCQVVLLRDRGFALQYLATNRFSPKDSRRR